MTLHIIFIIYSVCRMVIASCMKTHTAALKWHRVWHRFLYVMKVHMVIKQQNSGGHSSIFALETTYNLVATGPEMYEHQRLLYFWYNSTFILIRITFQYWCQVKLLRYLWKLYGLSSLKNAINFCFDNKM